MTAPPLSPDHARELDDLRRRAYGPGADIGQDAAAQRRLSELEQLLRRPVPDAPARTEPVTPDEPRPAALPAAPAALSAAPAAPADAVARVVDERPVPPDPPDARATTTRPAPRRLWRHPALWAIAAASLVVGVVIGVSAASMNADRPDLTLGLTSQPAERGDNWERTLSSWGFEPRSAVPYEPFNGLGVWTAFSDSGARCVLVSGAASPLTASCAAADLDPTLDMTVWEGMDAYFDDAPPIGTVIRFVAREGGIDVWVRPPGGAAQGQSVDTSWSDWSPSTP